MTGPVRVGRPPLPAPDWRDRVEAVSPTVLILGGFLTAPPLYWPMRRRLLRRGAAEVLIGPIWTPDWILAGSLGLGRVLRTADRALGRAATASARSPRTGGAPVLVVGHSTGGILGRLLAREAPRAGSRFGPAGAVGALVTMGTPHHTDPGGFLGRTIVARAGRFANRVAPVSLLARDIGIVTVGSRAVIGRPGGAGRERVAYALYRSFLSTLSGAAIEGDGLVPVAGALLDGTRKVVLDDIVHGQGSGEPWYGTDLALDRWWPEAIAAWRDALRVRAAESAGIAGRETAGTPHRGAPDAA